MKKTNAGGKLKKKGTNGFMIRERKPVTPDPNGNRKQRREAKKRGLAD